MTKFLLLTLSIVGMSFIMQDWITVNLDEKVSLAFPAKPQESNSSGNLTWSVEDSTGSRYLALIIDFASYGFDSAMLAKQLEGKTFYNGFRDAMLERLKGGTLVSEETSKLSGWPAYKTVVQMPGESGAITKLYGLNVFIGTKVYSVTFYENANKPQETSRTIFFDSFKVQ